MKTVLIAVVMAGLYAVPVFAVDNDMRGQGAPGKLNGERGGNQQGKGMTVTQKKAEILAHIDERISNSQAEKACVQSAQTHDALHACREKYRPQNKIDQQRGAGH